VSDVLITLDVDWAPDFAILAAARTLERAGVRATWFATHDSPATRELLARPDLFEVGIHPNFLPGSTHGPDPSAVLRHCLAVVPGARSMRSHGLFASTAILGTVIRETGIRIDGTLFLPRTAGLRPVDYFFAGRSLLRVPHFFEDDFEMERPVPEWRLAPLLALGDGLKVFDFHPIHVALNSRDMGPYTELKRRCPRLNRAGQGDMEDLVHRGPGAGTLFDDVVQHLARTGRPALTFSDLARGRLASGSPVEEIRS
jgi:hypothetical protein